MTSSPPAAEPTSHSAAATHTEVDYRVLWSEAPCGYLLTDGHGLITAVNETFLRWSGHHRADVLGSAWHRLLPMGDRIIWSTHCLPQLALSGAVAEIALDVIGQDGRRRAVLVSATRTVHPDQGTVEVRIIVFSAHERRRYELDLVAARVRAEESEARRAVAETHLERLALHDPLTGLLNRAGLMRAAAALVHDTQDPHVLLAALFIDLDHFKAVNDSLGHAAGDRLLATVASRLLATVREGAVVARLAGDEFVVVAPQVRDAGALGALADRVLTGVLAPLELEGLDVVVSASIGAAMQTHPDESLEDLLRHADAAMYRAKARGRSSWLLHEDGPPEEASGGLRLLGELRRGIDSGELRVFFQPRTELVEGNVAGVEALVRWQHPVRGLLMPGEFIDVAESSGLVRELGDRVLDRAVATAMTWQFPSHPLAGCTVAVNVSARQLSDPSLADRVRTVLQRHGLPPSQLVLEITETALMADASGALSTLQDLRSLGVELAIDDFGTGYSSFTYLKAFPVNELKIDRSFVAGMCSDAADHAIVASCVQLAHAMGLRAVAEGVECTEQLDALRDLGCDQAQGYLWAPALSAAELVEWSAGHAASTTPGHGSAEGASEELVSSVVRASDGLPEVPRGRSTSPSRVRLPTGDPGDLARSADHG